MKALKAMPVMMELMSMAVLMIMLMMVITMKIVLMEMNYLSKVNGKGLIESNVLQRGGDVDDVVMTAF